MIKEIFELQNPWRSRVFSPALKKRKVLEILLENLHNRKILGLIGSRHVGKSSLLYLIIEHLLQEDVRANHIFYFNLDDLKLHELFEYVPDFIRFIQPGENKKYVFIDEIQRLTNPGLFLKQIYDLNQNIKIIYSGSSQLEITSKLREHLVGRARQFEIHPLSFSEYSAFNHPIPREEALGQMLVFGSYPEVSLEKNGLDKQLALKDIYQSYVQKDLVDFLKIDNIDAFNKLLVLLANQIGSLLVMEHLANALKISRADVEKYISVLENTFVIKRIYPFHKNYKKEITKTPKIYFMDLGMRNFAINNFNDLTIRNDQGALFENFILLELLKNDWDSLNRINHWRTTNQTEIDFFVTRGNNTQAMEVKWDRDTIPKSFKTINRYYPEIKTRVVTRGGFLEGDSSEIFEL